MRERPTQLKETGKTMQTECWKMLCWSDLKAVGWCRRGNRNGVGWDGCLQLKIKNNFQLCKFLYWNWKSKMPSSCFLKDIDPILTICNILQDGSSGFCRCAPFPKSMSYEVRAFPNIVFPTNDVILPLIIVGNSTDSKFKKIGFGGHGHVH